MKVIVAVDEHWGIGYKGNLLLRIPDDMKCFKQLTIGKVVVMGRETFNSLPDRQPLKDRKNIVLSNQYFRSESLLVCHSLDDLFQTLENYNTDEVFVIGGESIYSQLLPYCSEAYVTKIKKSFTADKYFPDLDKEPAWEIQTVGNLKKYADVEYQFTKYVNTNLVSR
jgi:dihydrofolate reductase